MIIRTHSTERLALVLAGLLLVGGGCIHDPTGRSDSRRGDTPSSRQAGDGLPPIPVLDWEPRSDWLNVRAYGALGDDRHDDTAAIQAALDAVSDGGTVYLPPGIYRITETLLLARPRRMLGVMVVGHGRTTRLVWHGDDGGAIFHPDGVSNARYVGLVFDGRNSAGVGLINRNRIFETQSEHRHLAFLNFTDAGFLVHPERRQAVAEPLFDNCYFENNRRGIAFTRHNDYNFTISQCEFRDNDIGIQCRNGQFLLRNSHFYGSRNVDILAHPEHASSVRRCTSTGSRAFLHFSGAAGPLSVQDISVANWTDPEGAIRLGGAPVTLFDARFANGPDGAPPIRIERQDQRLIVSDNQLAGGGELYAQRERARIYEVPAGNRGPAIRSPGQRFLNTTVPVPGKVFDARRDFGARGDNRTDDTPAIQATIDAARAHGRGALAYLPTGTYRVTDTLRIEGRDYFVGGGGSGFRTQLRWDGPADGVMVAIHNPERVTLKHLSIGRHDVGRQNNAVDVLHTSDGRGSSMVYDGVWTYGLYQKEPDRKGFLFKDLGARDIVHIRHSQGNMRVENCGQATILANVAHEGALTVSGNAPPDAGLLGIIVRLSTIVTHAVYVHDNASLIMSDCYNEQSDAMFRFAGSAKLPPGRITWTGGRSHLSAKAVEPSMAIDGYHGDIFIGGKDFSDYRWQGGAAQARRLLATGNAPVTVTLFGNLFYGAAILPEGGPAFRAVRLGNAILPHPEWNEVIEPEDNHSEADLAALAQAFDDLRRLGEWDLKLNCDW